METDEGIVGLGEMVGGGESEQTAFAGLKPYLLGHDPFRLGELRFDVILLGTTFWEGIRRPFELYRELGNYPYDRDSERPEWFPLIPNDRWHRSEFTRPRRYASMLKVAIIGAGAISAAHIRAYLQFPERCRIVAVSDIYADKAEKRIREFGLDAKAVADYRELLEEEIDLVSVCTPPYTHAPLASDFLSAGAHVLVEKPMASSLEECDAMNEAARESGRLLSSVAQNRYRTPMMKLKSVLDRRLAGRIVHAQVDSFWWRGHCYYDLWWRGTWEKEGGGCTLNHAVHHIDMFLWMMGRPSEVHALMSNTSHDNAEVEDLSIALLKFPDGALAQITSSVVHHGEEQQLIFQGTDARISVPWKLKASRSKPNGFPDPHPELEETIQSYYDSLPGLAHEGHAGQIDDVLRAIESGGQVFIDGESGRATLELITAIYKSASTGQTVKLPLAPEDPFYKRGGTQAHATHFYEKTASVENFQDLRIPSGGNG